MRFGFAAVTPRLPFPISSFGRPVPVFVQLSPPSVLLKKPPSREPLMIVHGFRSSRDIHANTTFGLPGMSSTSMAPVLSETNSVFFQVRPPSVVLKTPPSEFGLKMSPTAATQTVFGSLG